MEKSIFNHRAHPLELVLLNYSHNHNLNPVNQNMKLFLNVLTVVSVFGMSNESQFYEEGITNEDFHVLSRENEKMRLGVEMLREEVDTLNDVVQKLQSQLDSKNAELLEISALCDHYKREKQQIEGVAEERLLKWTQCSNQLSQWVMNQYPSNHQPIEEDQLIHRPEGIAASDYTSWHQNSWSSYPEPPPLLSAEPVPLDDIAIGSQVYDIDDGYLATSSSDLMGHGQWASRALMDHAPPLEGTSSSPTQGRAKRNYMKHRGYMNRAQHRQITRKQRVEAKEVKFAQLCSDHAIHPVEQVPVTSIDSNRPLQWSQSKK